MSKTKPFFAWRNALTRCYNPNASNFDRYGGRGIAVCDQWRDSFLSFYEDMGEPPTPKHTLERVDRNGDYCPENCIWDTYKKQMRNTCRNRIMTILGRSMCLTDWAKLLGFKPTTLFYRLSSGWSDEQALLVPTEISSGVAGLIGGCRV